MKLDYIANQLTPEGLDEIQRTLIAQKLGQHVAMSGPPGVGKTDVITQIPKIIERPIYDITCDSYMTESPLVGFPELEGENGSSVTVWRNGVASEAASENGIFYGDEFDLLPGSVQKRLNSLFDDRRNIRRRDGTVISAGDDFMGIISYNPTVKLSKRELEEAVADRFVHMSFNYLPPELEAAIGSNDFSSLGLEERAILDSGESIRFLRKDKNTWKDFFTNEKVKHSDSAIVYNAVPYQGGELLSPTKMKKKEIAGKLADLFVSVRSFGDKGTNDLPDNIKQYLSEIGEVTSVPLHKPSVRIMKAALGQYDFLTELGMEGEQAQSYATRLCVDQACYGKFGERSLGKVSVHDAVTSMAQFYDLLGKPKQTTSF